MAASTRARTPCQPISSHMWNCFKIRKDINLPFWWALHFQPTQRRTFVAAVCLLHRQGQCSFCDSFCRATHKKYLRPHPQPTWHLF
jgi:hypothetical protein